MDQTPHDVMRAAATMGPVSLEYRQFARLTPESATLRGGSGSTTDISRAASSSSKVATLFPLLCAALPEAEGVELSLPPPPLPPTLPPAVDTVRDRPAAIPPVERRLASAVPVVERRAPPAAPLMERRLAGVVPREDNPGLPIQTPGLSSVFDLLAGDPARAADEGGASPGLGALFGALSSSSCR